jgi:anti-sigma-K factor RskA
VDSKHVEDLIAGYVLSTLTPDERRDVEAHLHGCSRCEQLAREFRSVAGLLPLAAEPATPPQGLKAKLLARARADLQEVGEARPSVRVRARSLGWLRTPAFAGAAAGVALAAAIGLAVWNVQLQSTVDDRDQEIARLQEGERLALVHGTDAAPGATGQVVYLPQQDLALLRVKGLPPAPADRTYQIWLIKDGVPASAGFLQVSPTTQEGVSPISGDPRQAQVIAVTVEPPGGVPQPTGRVVLRGDL